MYTPNTLIYIHLYMCVCLWYILQIDDILIGHDCDTIARERAQTFRLSLQFEFSNAVEQITYEFQSNGKR